MMPDEDLIQAEWEKHGTCYYATAHDYYVIAERLFYGLDVPPNLKTLAQNPTASTANQIKTEFLKLNPKLRSTNIVVQTASKNKLKEIQICYDLNYNFADCKQ